MSYPSVKTLCELTNGDKTKAKNLRLIITGQSGHVRITSRLEACDEILGTCGVEHIERGSNAKSPAISYCNTGDPYTTTLMYVWGDAYLAGFKVGCWGDIVERGNYA